MESQFSQDYTQIYLLGLKYYCSGIWPYWGPDITYTSSQMPGALQGLLVGLPFYISERPEAPFVFLNLLSTLSLAFFSWYISKRLKGIPKWFLYCTLLFSPWTLNFSTTVLNPSYILAPSILFFVSVIELLPIYKEKIISQNLAFAFVGFTLGWILQIHLSWVLLPFYILLIFCFLFKTKKFKQILFGSLSFTLGFLLIIWTYFPTIVKYGFVTSDLDSTVVFNPTNFKNIDIITRFLSFSTFDARQFVTGGLNGEKSFLLNNIWASPFIVFVFIIGIAQSIYYLTFFFRKINYPEFKWVKLLTFGSILLLYVSYLFAVRELSSYTLYILLPISFWFSFYCLEPLFEKTFWKKFAVLFVLSGFIFHITLAKENYPTNSLYTRYHLIDKALQSKDSRFFAYRRTQDWEKSERVKTWRKIIQIQANDTILSFFNNFDHFPVEIIPECLSKESYVSFPYSYQIDSLNPYSLTLTVPLSEIKNKRNISLSFLEKHKLTKDYLVVFSIEKDKKSLFWSGEKIITRKLNTDQWEKVTLSKEMPKIKNPELKLGIYIYHPTNISKQKLQIDDFKIEFR